MTHWKNHKRAAALSLALFVYPVSGDAQSQSPPPAEAAASGAATGAARVLTLGDAVLLALKNQPAIRAARQRVNAQDAILGQAKSAYYPTINLNGTWTDTTQSGQTTSSPQDFVNVNSATRLDWTVYDFGKREGSVEQERDSLQSRRFAERTSVEEVVVNVKRAYYRYLQAKVLVRVREDTVRDRETLVRQAKGFFEVGTRPRIDVARAEANLYGAEAELIGAQNGVKITWAELKNAIGLEDFPVRPLAEEALLDRPVETLSEELKIVRPAFSFEKALDTAYSLRPELKDFEAQRKARDAAIATARRGHLPDLTFNSSYGRRGANTRTGKGIYPLDLNWSVGFAVNIPIFNGFQTTYEVEEAMSNYSELEAIEAQTRQQIALEVERSYLNIIETAERIRATEAAARSAKENLDLANGRYRVGVGSIIEITEAQVINTLAQTNLIQAIADYKIFEADLAKAVGQGVAR